MQRQRFITTIKSVIGGEKKKTSKLNRFHSAIKIDNYSGRGQQ